MGSSNLLVGSNLDGCGQFGKNCSFFFCLFIEKNHFRANPGLPVETYSILNNIRKCTCIK